MAIDYWLQGRAGIDYPASLTDVDDLTDAFSRQLDNKATCMGRRTNALLPAIQDSRCVIGQSSIGVRIGALGFSAHVAGECAVIGHTRALACGLDSRAIRANAFCPGWVFTVAAKRLLHALVGSDSAEVVTVRQAVMA